MREYSDIQIDAEFTDNMVDVIDGGYDAVIRSGEQSDSRLMSKRLGSYRLEVVGSPCCIIGLWANSTIRRGDPNSLSHGASFTLDRNRG
jgi:DNA-binding transcriptional LysR family regulator